MKFFTPALLVVFLAAAGCQEENAQIDKPVPIALTSEAAGHYCQMIILEHPGPKGQVHLVGHTAPLWFSQVRDGLAYLISEEKTAEISVLYVNDMGKASNWLEPGENNWIDVKLAYFVVGSDAKGGMGAPEIVPFGDAKMAADFARRRGGEVKRLSEITTEMVLAPVDIAEPVHSDATLRKLL